MTMCVDQILFEEFEKFFVELEFWKNFKFGFVGCEQSVRRFSSQLCWKNITPFPVVGECFEIVKDYEKGPFFVPHPYSEYFEIVILSDFFNLMDLFNTFITLSFECSRWFLSFELSGFF